MKQKLVAAAVAGAFAMPGAALAQVTISGTFAVGMSQGKVSEAAAGGHLGLNTSSNFIRSAGAMRFGLTEDLGGGTSFTGLWEIRPILDGYNDAASPNAVPTGSTTPQAWVGLRNNSWGQVRLGNMTVWGARGSVSGGPSAFHHAASNLTDYQQIGVTGAVTSVIAGRQRNLVLYETPKFGGFQMNAAYSTANNGNDSDLTVATRKGSAWYLAPEFDAGFVKFGMVHANQKADAATNHYKGNKLYANGKIGPITTGIVYASWRGESAAGLNNLNTTSWYIPVNYSTGSHKFGFILGKANDNKNVVGDQSAKVLSFAYNYSLSKRTWLSLSHTRLTNAAGAGYDLSSFTGAKDGADNFTSGLGEDLTSTTVGLHHSF